MVCAGRPPAQLRGKLHQSLCESDCWFLNLELVLYIGIPWGILNVFDVFTPPPEGLIQLFGIRLVQVALVILNEDMLENH